MCNGQTVFFINSNYALEQPVQHNFQTLLIWSSPEKQIFSNPQAEGKRYKGEVFNLNHHRFAISKMDFSLNCPQGGGKPASHALTQG